MKKLICVILMLALLSCSVQCFADTYPVIVTDAAGREITIEGHPQRIVSGYYISTSMIIALGLRDRLVGIESKAETREIYALAAPELLELPGVGTAKQLDLELVLSLEPDLVMLPMKQLASAETLAELGIDAIVVDPESYDDMLFTFGLIAEACGADPTELTDYYSEKESMLSEMLSGCERPRVYISGNSEFLRTAGEGMYQDTLVTMAGGENVASEISGSSWADISYEQLLAWDPDVIVLASDASYTVDDVLNDDMLAGLKCIENGNVFALPSSPEAWDSPIPAAVLGSMYIAARLHPDMYTPELADEEVSGFYTEFYGFDPLTGSAK